MSAKLPVVEIFDSLQGEGPYLHPAIFLRTALCCFKCKGFNCSLMAPDGSTVTGCDTIRAVSPKFKESWTYYEDSLSLIKALEEHVKTYPHSNFKQDLVLTGGEPLLHFNNPVLIESLEHFYRLGHTLTVETNATLPIAFDKTVLTKARFSMSVKLSNSGESRDKRINYSTIRAIVDNTEQSYFKFVVSKDTWEHDKEEIFEILDNTGRSIPVYLMPLGGDFKSLQNNTQFVVEKCIEQGFFYTDRIHIRAWNTKEGV